MKFLARHPIDETPLPANLNAPDWAEQGARSAIRRALALRREVERFETRWPQPPQSEAPALPQISWRQIERQLEDLATTPDKAAMARELVSATRKMAAFKPPEMVLREILCLTWALLDEDFQPGLDPDGEGGSADMP